MKEKKDNEEINREDRQIVARILDGNKNEFSKIERRYGTLIYSLLRKMVHNSEDAKDLTQETFIKIYNNLASYNPIYPFSSWILKISSNTCIDFLRKKKIDTIPLEKQDDDNENDIYLQIPDTTSIPDKTLINKEKIQNLNKLIDMLPETYQKIIKLRFEDDLNYIEISETLNIPLGTVKTLIFRARKMLEILAKKHNELL
ncbi:MAG TPA: RNA polymerase sigma factor [Bacteroidota bacterium]|nr:RNA polymerase sigma factor [Candidatus Kapabacteria bacterium]HRS02543.1 RNA polymerase sigma factor [Bacteroidota bacterium]